MFGPEITYPALTLIVFAGAVDATERRRPRFHVDRTYKLGLNIASLGIVIFGGELWKPALSGLFSLLRLESALAFKSLREMPGAIKIILGLISADFCLYWVHRGMHRRRLLWLTHTFHHSIDELWWLSGSRTSLTHLMLFAAPQTLISYHILRLTPPQAGIAFSAGVLVNIWIHANISARLGPLEWLIITPNYHRIHHGGSGLAGRNLGFVFTVWDRLFGTYSAPARIGDAYKLSAVPMQGRLTRLIIGV